MGSVTFSDANRESNDPPATPYSAVAPVPAAHQAPDRTSLQHPTGTIAASSASALTPHPIAAVPVPSTATGTIHSLTTSQVLTFKLQDGATSAPAPSTPVMEYSATTEELLRRFRSQVTAATGTPGYEAAREQVLRGMVTSDKLPIPPPSTAPKRGRGRGRGRGSALSRTASTGESTPVSASPVERGRGRVGRPRGRGRGGGRGGKRKREESADDDEDSEDDSEISSSYAPMPTRTKSGRNVNKPTQFVPTIPSPTREPKRRKVHRRTMDSAVCTMCKRGVSTSQNTIVFCDKCSKPYHMYCHDPPIDREFVDIAEKEWFCLACSPVEGDPAVSRAAELDGGANATFEDKRAYLFSLSRLDLVNMILKMASAHPELAIIPLKTPTTSATISTPNSTAALSAAPQSGSMSTALTGGSTHVAFDPQTAFEEDYDSDLPAHYPKPGKGLIRNIIHSPDDPAWVMEDNDVFSHTVNYDSSVEPNGDGSGPGSFARYINATSDPTRPS